MKPASLRGVARYEAKQSGVCRMDCFTAFAMTPAVVQRRSMLRFYGMYHASSPSPALLLREDYAAFQQREEEK
jgi:hypothetical protein